ncbi:hypothetical protein GCM10022198_03030 [Klugiella xanthotipulae]|uniref:Putative superfamily III holin-X n=1 Tax=Klugiella xanthotipulae TaxID=244735 RepID=A0A543I775_9MICO|nr:phage holin family protein [Klugiella xanthotipulae]TQM66401.1 putative superfamily III holin-X [Klugiella xanthotipulae]
MTERQQRAAERESLFALLTKLPAQLIALARAELDNAKKELAGKLKRLGLGLGLLIVALFFVFFSLACFVVAAIAGIAVALPVWLAALIVAVALLLITALCVWIGIKSIGKGVPIPEKTLDSIEQDFRAMSEASRKNDE